MMALIESEIQNIVDKRQNWREKKLDDSAIRIELKASSTLNRWVALKFMADAFEIRDGKKLLEKWKQQNLIGNTQAIEVIPGEKENEMVQCIGCNQLIRRHECLDISGNSKKAYEECVCPIGEDTRKILLNGKTFPKKRGKKK